MFYCNKVMFLYESQAHVANYCKFKLSTDIEKNPVPRPLCVNPSKTVAAPYSQGNELAFGQNAGQQRVAMSLYCLIYNIKQGIGCAKDHSNSEYWKSVVFKFVSISQTVLFNADRITNNVKCA